jgi:adenylate cyclase
MERKLRIASGLTLFAFVACHFLGHASGVFGVATMEFVGRDILLAVWRTSPARAVLLAALMVHAGLGLRALFRRRHLRMPLVEAWQIGLGLAIPPLLAAHVIDVRIGSSVFGLDDTYPRVLAAVWADPSFFARQFVLLVLVWAHGCIGLNFWLVRFAWYRRHREFFLCGAVAMPCLAALGVVNAGWDAATAALRHPAAATAPAAATGVDAAAVLSHWIQNVQIGYGVLLGLALIAWAWRNGLPRRSMVVRVAYPNGRVVGVPRGFSILETSRWAGIPHASSCGGRGRCSTCRVRIVAGEKHAPAILPAERETLERVKAPPHVRLACQLRPTADIEVAPLVPVAPTWRRAGAVDHDSREMLVTAMFVDLRDSTRFAAARLPFDALYILERYVHLVTVAIEAHGGVVTGVAGDGVMSIFGFGASPRAGARGALRAIGSAWDAIDALSQELAAELDHPLAFGAGLHASFAAVRSIEVAGQPSLQFLGDAGNIASRLEAATKTHNCICVVSESVFDVAETAIPETLARQEMTIRGLEDRLVPVRLVHDRAEADFADFASPAEDEPV